MVLRAILLGVIATPLWATGVAETPHLFCRKNMQIGALQDLVTRAGVVLAEAMNDWDCSDALQHQRGRHVCIPFKNGYRLHDALSGQAVKLNPQGLIRREDCQKALLVLENKP